MSLEEQVVDLLHQKIGFNPESIGRDKVLAGVRSALTRLQIGDEQAFLNALRPGNAAYHAIVSAVVVPETWFFRDGAPFEFLQRHVSSQWHTRGGEPLRCLSVPCSTGEEPYSIAIALIEAGLLTRQFSIDAVDINAAALERARTADYGEYSFRGVNGTYRTRYFERSSGGHRVNEDVRATVRFSQGNLLEPLFLQDAGQYDIIYCRNLLIYFGPAHWTQAIQTLQRLLKDSGLLFMGHAEMLELNATQFESVRARGAFAYRKQRKPAPSPLPHSPKKAGATPAAVVRKKPRRGNTKPALKRTPDEPLNVPPEKMIAQATRLADEGKLARAAEICLKILDQSPGHAQAYFLLGLIAESEGNASGAEKHYNRALYLDSRHHEALVHLALLLEGRGDTDAAANLRKRARQAVPQT